MKQISIFFIVAMLAGCYSATPEKTGLEGKPLPGFNLLLPDSATWVNTSNAPKGKPVLLFGFSPYCPYCRAQTKEIIEDMDELKDIQFYFITPFPYAHMKKFWKEFELQKYPNITIGTDTANAISKYFDITAVPYLAIYNKEQKLNKVFMSKIPTSQLKKATEE